MWCLYCNKYEKLKDWPESERPEAFIYEEVEYPENKPIEFKFSERRFVVCLDTLGQDRIFTPEQRAYVRNWVRKSASGRAKTLRNPLANSWRAFS